MNKTDKDVSMTISLMPHTQAEAERLVKEFPGLADRYMTVYRQMDDNRRLANQLQRPIQIIEDFNDYPKFLEADTEYLRLSAENLKEFEALQQEKLSVWAALIEILPATGLPFLYKGWEFSLSSRCELSVRILDHMPNDDTEELPDAE